MDDVTILQITPALDWWAIFGANSEAEEFASRLVCWALVEDAQGEWLVVGIDCDQRGTVEIAAYANNFRRYEYQTQVKPREPAP